MTDNVSEALQNLRGILDDMVKPKLPGETRWGMGPKLPEEFRTVSALDGEDKAAPYTLHGHLDADRRVEISRVDGIETRRTIVHEDENWVKAGCPLWQPD